MTASVGMPGKNVRWHDTSGWLALLPGLALMVVFFVLPALKLLEISFYPHELGSVLTPGFTLDNYIRFLTDSFYLSKLWLTIRLSVVVTIVTLILSYPVAYVLVRGHFVGKGLIIGLVLSPLLTNFIVLVFAWMLLLGPQSFIVKLLHSLTGSPIKLLYAEPGLIIALVHVSIPYALIPLIASLAQVRKDLEEASVSLGAGPWKTFFLVVLPLTYPGAMSAAFVVVSIVLSGFAFALFIGGDSVLIVPLLIWQAVNDTHDWAMAAAMSFVAFIVVVLLLFLSMWLSGMAWARGGTQ
jgi:putative spermidine/putrescine transport system permease protein